MVYYGKSSPNLIDKLTTEEELSGIFNVLMVALRRVLQHGKITMNEKTIAERRAKYEMISNPVKCFVETAFDQDSLENDFTTKDMTSQAYHIFCVENKIAALSKEALGKKLSGEFKWDDAQIPIVIQDKKQRVRCWIGHKLTIYYLKKLGYTKQETLTP